MNTYNGPAQFQMIATSGDENKTGDENINEGLRRRGG